jgi:hypothetical protein
LLIGQIQSDLAMLAQSSVLGKGFTFAKCGEYSADALMASET